jgi:hypothetical protein
MKRPKFKIIHEYNGAVDTQANKDFINICLKNKQVIDILLPYLYEDTTVSNFSQYINIDKVKYSKNKALVVGIPCNCGETHQVWQWHK